MQQNGLPQFMVNQSQNYWTCIAQTNWFATMAGSEKQMSPICNSYQQMQGIAWQAPGPPHLGLHTWPWPLQPWSSSLSLPASQQCCPRHCSTKGNVLVLTWLVALHMPREDVWSTWHPCLLVHSTANAQVVFEPALHLCISHA